MDNKTITIFSTQKSSRLDYVLNWLLGEVLQLPYELVHDEEKAKHHAFYISYGKKIAGSFSIPDAGLLWQTGVRQHDIATGSWNELPAIYANTDGYSLPFDIFSAIFFLLSRYEEYYSFTPDKHDRYPATDSLLYKNGWLRRPLVDEWVFAFRQLLVSKGFELPKQVFSYHPTYDIDIAYSYLYKDKARSSGGELRDLLKFNFKAIRERALVRAGKMADPYDSFNFIAEIHEGHAHRPVFFFLAAFHPTSYDKNIPPDSMQMQKLMKKLEKAGSIGLHPSYYSNDGDTMRREKELMEVIVGHKIHSSRQHYIKLRFPATYHELMKHGITHEYSMGYSTHIGFRAGTSRPFHWYDLKNEHATHLRVIPFCFMDTTAKYDENLGVLEAFIQLRDLSKKIQNVGGQLVTIFHNFSLGTDRLWAGWKEEYTKFVADMQKLH